MLYFTPDINILATGLELVNHTCKANDFHEHIARAKEVVTWFGMPPKSTIIDYGKYAILYSATILCNKYVLSSLGFQYPTIFQAWQTFVSLSLIYSLSGNVMKNVTVSEILPWTPAMILYVGSIYCGSKALARLSVPVFLLSHGASDVILISCDSYLPSGAVHFSMPLKMSGMLLALWSAHYDSSIIDLTWILLHAIFSGAYRTAAFWYTTPQWPYSGLTTIQRQYLNNILGLVTLSPLAFFLGHHHDMQNHFLYLGEVKFYIGCLCSGVLGWAVNYMWGKVGTRIDSAETQMVQLAAKVMTVILSLQLFPVTHTVLLWIAIMLGLSGDISHIIGSMFEKPTDHGHDMSDVLVGS